MCRALTRRLNIFPHLCWRRHPAGFTASRPTLDCEATARPSGPRLTAGSSSLESFPSDGRTATRCFPQQSGTWRCFHSSAKAPQGVETLYTKNHVYLRFLAHNCSLAVVGITEFAVDELVAIARVTAPISDKRARGRVNEGDIVCKLEALRSMAEVHAPVSGSVLKFNEKVKDNPVLINRDPEGEGWLFLMLVHPMGTSTEQQARQDALKSQLLSAAAYADYVNR
ncbi:hypothetical protein ACSSS7_002013 [Eimeria intestinalis]